MNENKIPCWTNGKNEFEGTRKLNDRVGSEQLPTDILIHKIAIDGALLRQDILADELSVVRRRLNQEERNTAELMRILMKIPAGWPGDKVPEPVLDWHESEFDLDYAEAWIDHAVKGLEKLSKVEDISALEENNEGLKSYVEALTRVVADQKNNIDDIMTTLAEQVSLINEQKQIIKAAQNREDKTVRLETQLFSLQNLCDRLAKENKRLKRIKK